MSTPAGLAHLRELAGRKSKLYELPLAMENNSSADAACFRSLAAAVDRALFNEVSIDDAALNALQAFVAEPAGDLASTLAVLDVACSEAEPNRQCVQILFAGFPRWLALASPESRTHFLEVLPNIAAHLKDLGNAGVETLIGVFKGCSSPHERDIIARCIVGYQETSAEIIVAAARIGERFLRTSAGQWVERMLAAVTLEAMIESKDSRALLPALEKISIADASEPVLSAATAVCVAVARHNHSSALNLSKQLGGAVAPLPHEARVPYLKAFVNVIEAAGVAMTGYCSKQLPALFQKTGPDRATAFAAEGIAIAQRYGKVAAQEFFDQRTAAAKEAAASA